MLLFISKFQLTYTLFKHTNLLVAFCEFSLDLAYLPIDRLDSLGDALLHALFQHRNITLPWSMFFSTESFWFDWKQEPIQSPFTLRLLRNNKDVIWHDTNLLCKGWLLTGFCDSSESISHDCNQHVQKCNMSDKSCKAEYNPSLYVTSLLSVPESTFCVKFSHAHNILV